MENKSVRALLATGLIMMATTSSTFGQGSNVKKNLSDANWLLGTWETITPKRTIFETWKKLNDNEFAGKSYAISGADTMVFEKVQLVRRGEGVFYIPTVTNQNSGKPVTFKSKSFSESEMVFVNPEHDFPQQVAYTRVSSDSLHAVVSGTVNGRIKTQEFKMRKVKN